VAHYSWPSASPPVGKTQSLRGISQRGNEFGHGLCATSAVGTPLASPLLNRLPKTITHLPAITTKQIVMLRITTLNADGSPAIVKLEGKLLEPWISELQEACRAARKQDVSMTLDLAGLSYIDTPGTIALRDLIRRGVSVTGCTPLVSELLKETLR
jgi:ABC-type transporter Mla MlaB component